MTTAAAEQVLPAGLVCFRRTVTFSHQNVPKALLSAHSVKPGVWGVLRVVRGRLRYCVEGASPVTRVIAEGGFTVIEPSAPHYVELLDADSAFFVEFYRVHKAFAGT